MLPELLEKINFGGIMLKNIFPVSLLILLVLIGCSNEVENQIYTGVLEGKSIQVPALTPGKILKFPVETGQEVVAGDTIAIVDTTELVLQIGQLNAGINVIKTQMEIAKTSSQRAESDLKYIQEKYDRMEKLVANQTMPHQTLDDLKVQLDRAVIGSKTAKQTILSIEAKKDQILAQIKSIKKKISDCFIIAPEQGIIANKYFECGEAVPPMSPVVEIIHIKSIDVKIYVAEKTLPELKHEQEVSILVDGLDEELKGKVSWISPKAEFTPKNILTPETRSSLVFAVKINIKNPDGILKHGMPVEVVI